MQNGPLIIERTYNAPSDKVWAALTSKAAMKEWCFDVSGFEPKVGYVFTFEGSNDCGNFQHECVVTIAEPNKLLAFSWRYIGYEGNSLVTYELFDEGDKTRVRLTHVGLETIAVNGKGFERESFEGGWTDILGTLLMNYLEK
ncbi:MAG: Activator of Hsp90 ATPase 1 family protein [Flavipsychrobacter sp.]|nr:Activator of Hsp90 ATPase 1 family protein [Flavipsychrobacter sp.]